MGVGQGGENGGEKVTTLGRGYFCLRPYASCTPVSKLIKILPVLNTQPLKSGHKMKSGIKPILLVVKYFFT